ncbi:Nucleic acid-binding protein [Corchorus capsularis]|uniref:Nucleic acid-binding protein n=1 Tax=Corchorus capsularis TaxID=210143 RepID=A0A1R3G4F0_COCAP|nr:Nucleic acid-binding protein [Corchorus capsularis]
MAKSSQKTSSSLQTNANSNTSTKTRFKQKNKGKQYEVRIVRMWDAINSKTGQLIGIAMVVLDQQGKSFTAKVKIINIDTTFGWYYLSCSCNRKVTENGDKYRCNYCNIDVKKPSPRYKVNVEAHDDSGTASFVLFNTEASHLLKKSVDELYKTSLEIHGPSVPSLSPLKQSGLTTETRGKQKQIIGDEPNGEASSDEEPLQSPMKNEESV